MILSNEKILEFRVNRKVADDQVAYSGLRSSLAADLGWAALWKAASGQAAYSGL